jgi:hypothetical protein
MSIQITITATDAVDLGAKVASLFHTITDGSVPVMDSAPQAEAVEPPRKSRGRPPKTEAKVIEGEVVKPSESAKAEEPSEQPDQGDAEAPAVTAGEVRDAIVKYVNDHAVASGKGDDTRREKLTELRQKFGFHKIPEIPPEKYRDILAFLEANKVVEKADDDIA